MAKRKGKRRPLRKLRKRVQRAANRGVKRQTRKLGKAVKRGFNAGRSTEIRRASQEWSNGERILPPLKSYPRTNAPHWRKLDPATEREEYIAVMEGKDVTFHVWSYENAKRKDLHNAATKAAVQQYGPYAESWPVTRITATNDAARERYPRPL